MANEISTKEETKKVKLVKCQIFDERCSICGTHFEEDVCSSGHQIGHNYTISIGK